MTISLTCRYNNPSLISGASINAIQPPIIPSTISKSLTINSISDYKRYILDSLTIPSEASNISLTIDITINSNSDVYIDYLSFDNKLSLKTNLVDNGYFEEVDFNEKPNNFILTNCDSNDKTYINITPNLFTKNSNNVRSFKFMPCDIDFPTYKEIKQYLFIDGSKNDKYTLSVIAKSLVDYSSIFRVIVKFFTTSGEDTYIFDFDKNNPNYQALVKCIKVKDNYTQILLAIQYNGTNEALIDSLELYKEGNDVSI